MSHFKCVTCRTRHFNAGGSVDLIDDLCPSCGIALEPVGALAEIVGFQAITASDQGASSTHDRVVDSLGDLLARRALRAQALRWDQDADGATAEAVALPRPETTC